MALLHVTFFSEALNVQTSVDVILPEIKQGIGVDAAQEEALPKVLYLLHGYSDDHTIWQRRTSVERYAARHNLAVVMPAVNHSFYCNEVHGERYWDYVAEDLPRQMQHFFRLSDKPEDTFVAGLSMGGYGAMKLALNFPERFGAAASFSGAADIVTDKEKPLLTKVVPRATIKDGDYIEPLVWFTNYGTRGVIGVILHNALCINGMSWKIDDKKVATCDVEFRGHADSVVLSDTLPIEYFILNTMDTVPKDDE